jgi:peptidoglycan/LPS O-acetylase OafA/YrhL
MIFNNKMAILEVMNKSNGNVRNSNIELLRIITILGVFFLHLYNPLIGGGIKLCNSQINEFLLRILESQFVCSVNLFILISGFFLSKQKGLHIVKPIKLLVQVI